MVTLSSNVSPESDCRLYLHCTTTPGAMAAKKIKFESPSDHEHLHTDWTKCALCQKHSSEPLRDPSQCSNTSQSRGYETIAENLLELEALHALPLDIQLSRLNDGDGIASTLQQNNAKWHKTCYTKFSNSKVDRVRKKIARLEANEPEISPLKSKLRSAFPRTSDQSTNEICFFCDEAICDLRAGHRAATPRFDTNVRQMATELRDTKLLAKLSCGDMTAIDAVYHKQCLTTFHNRYRSFLRQTASNIASEDLTPEAMAFAELVSYIEDARQVEEPNEHIFKLSSLVKLYRSRLEQLGGDTSQRTNSTRLSDKILTHIPDLQAHKSKYEVVLTFRTDIAHTLLEATKRDHESDAVVLMKAAKIIRKETCNKQYKFTGSLLDEQYDDVPSSLRALVQMILGGTNIEKQTENDQDVKAAAVSITELIMFNTLKRGRKNVKYTRHSSDRETRLPLYLGLLIHNKTRKRDLIDLLFEKGLSVSYDRVLQLSTDISNGVLSIYEENGVVCPTVMRSDLFTTGNLDNIDHDPTSTSAQTAFHGTAISLTQHVTNECAGKELHQNQDIVSRDALKSTKIKPLMELYSTVPPASFPNECTTKEQVNH